MTYLRNLLIAHDQLVNAWLGGWPDETLSSRAHRLRLAGKPRLASFIDCLFFWDRENGRRHCQLSYESEKERKQFPPELR